MEWKIRKNHKEIYTEEFWYDLTSGGYLKPEDILSDKSQIEKLKEAIDLVSSFENLVDGLMEND